MVIKMDMEYTKAIVRTIWDQIMAMVDFSTYGSWGVSAKGISIYKGMPSLRMRVNGMEHKGDLLVCYNSGQDLYEVVALKDGKEVKRENGVYCDNLGAVIDRMVEKDCPQEEYEAKVRRLYGV